VDRRFSDPHAPGACPVQALVMRRSTRQPNKQQFPRFSATIERNDVTDLQWRDRQSALLLW
jgi:hypothetical protein